MKKNKSLFARNVTFLRSNLKMTRVRAAEMSGIHFKTWCAYEEGRAKPQLDKLPIICQTLQFWDVMALIDKDLANDRSVHTVDLRQALESVTKIQQYLSSLDLVEIELVDGKKITASMIPKVGTGGIHSIGMGGPDILIHNQNPVTGVNLNA